MKAAAAAISVLAIALGASGCGSDEDDAATSDISTADFAAAVEERCATYQDEIDAATANLTDLPPMISDISANQLEEIGPDLKALNEVTRNLIDDLEALPVPEADADRVNAFFAVLDEGKAGLDAADAAIDDGDGYELSQGWNALNAISEEANKPENFDLGFYACN